MAQAINRMTIYAVELACALLELLEYEKLNELLILLLAVAALALLWLANSKQFLEGKKAKDI